MRALQARLWNRRALAVTVMTLVLLLLFVVPFWFAIGIIVRNAGQIVGWAESIKSMEKRGLTVTRVTPEIEAEWRTAAEAVYPMIRGKIVPEDIFDQALRLIKECRATKAQ